jgi:hypothetical protein
MVNNYLVSFVVIAFQITGIAFAGDLFGQFFVGGHFHSPLRCNLNINLAGDVNPEVDKPYPLWLDRVPTERTTMIDGITAAVDKAGSQAKLAEQIGVRPQFITKALRQGWLPMEKAKIVNDLHGIPLIDLVRADIADAMRLAAKN